MDSLGAAAVAVVVFAIGNFNSDPTTRIIMTIVACTIFLVSCCLYYRNG